MRKLLILIAVCSFALGLEKQTYKYENQQDNKSYLAGQKEPHPDQQKIDYYNSLKPNYDPGETGPNPNTINLNFTVSGDRSTVEVYFCNDYWASESSWNVFDSDSAGYYDGNYNSGYLGSYGCASEYLDLADGDYTLTLYDSYGDGGLCAGVYEPGVSTYLEYFCMSGSEESAAFSVGSSDGGDGCADTEYTWNCGGGSWGSEVGWNLGDDAGGTGTGTLCLTDGDYTLNMTDAYGDGWNGNTWTLSDENGVAASCGLSSGSAGSCEFTLGGPPPVSGCTDPTAENFDPNATLDDGSCTWNGGCTSPSYTACDDGTCIYASWWCDGSNEWGNAGWGPDCPDDSDEDFDACCEAGAYEEALCNPPEICEDTSACNYSAEGSCEYPATGYNCDGSIADGYFADCIGTVATESYLGWIGDGYCDDGAWGLVFTCCDFNMDNGDCGDAMGCDGIAADCGGGSLDDCGTCDSDASNNCQSVSINYDFGQDITGFQFDLAGVTIVDNSVSGGAAGEFFDLVTSSSTMVIGISLSNTPIPSGAGILTNLMVVGELQNATLENVTLTGGNLQEVASTTEGLTIVVACIDADGDGICVSDDLDDNCLSNNIDCAGICDGNTSVDCAGICDGNAVIDECGECNGSGFPDGACDCEGNTTDCAGVCGGDSDVDACGVCNGDGISGCPEEFSFVQSTSQVFYEIMSATYNGQPLTENDLIGVYSNGSCTGFSAWLPDGNGTIVAANGNDGISPGTQNYFVAGDQPQFVYYIADKDEIYPADFDGCVDQLFEETDCSFYNLAYYQIANLYAGSGCSDPVADNYNPYVLTDDGTCTYNLSLSLVEGNNLVSFPGIPNGMATTDFLSMIPGANFIITNRMVLFRDGDEWYGNLNTVNQYLGYWINVSSAIDLPVLFPDISMDHCHEYTLEYGNNLVAYFGFDGDPTLQSLGCDPIGSTNLCETFWFAVGDGVGIFNSTYTEDCEDDFCWSGNLNNFHTQKGYWIYLDEFDYPFHDGLEYYFSWNMGSDCEIPSAETMAKSNPPSKSWQDIPEGFKSIQSTQQAFYLIKEIDLHDGNEPQQGDLFIVSKNGNVAGSAWWDEEYTVLPVMGADNSPGTEKYPIAGDLLDIRLYRPSENKFYHLDGNIPQWSNLGIHTLDRLTQSAPSVPLDFTLLNPYPNPFNGETVIQFSIPEKNNVSLDIYDLHGQHVITLENAVLDEGDYTFNWNSGSIGSGLYFVRLTSGDFVKTTKVVLLK